MSRLCSLIAGAWIGATLAACSAPPLPLSFELASIGQASGVSLGKTSRNEAMTTVQPLSFLSTQWTQNGSPQPITLRGFLAAPSGPGRHPAVVLAHGLGDKASALSAFETARAYGAVTLALSGPGQGASGGQGASFEDPSSLFATIPDPRGSWLYAYVHGVMRAVTVLLQRSDVDPQRIVVTGISMGGIAALLAGSTDLRIRAVMAVNAAGGWDAAIAAGSWLDLLIKGARGRTRDTPDVRAFVTAFDPLRFVGRLAVPVILLSGAQDEFFPLDQVVRTYDAIGPRADKRLSLMPDFDHQWYFAAGCPAPCMPGAPNPGLCPGMGCPSTCPGDSRWPYCGPQSSYDRHSEFEGRWSGALRALLAATGRAATGRAATGELRSPLPPAPQIIRQGSGIRVDQSPSAVAMELAWSNNGGFTFAQENLKRDATGIFGFEGVIPHRAIVFAQARFSNGAVITSTPTLPPGFRPQIRPWDPRGSAP